MFACFVLLDELYNFDNIIHIAPEIYAARNDSEGEEQGTQDDEGELGAWGYVMPVQDDVDDDERSDRDDTNDSDEEDPDRVVPDEGDELDDDVYAREGYGAL